MRQKTKERIERIDAAVAAGTELAAAVAAEDITMSWYYHCKSAKKGKKQKQALQVFPIDAHVLAAHSTEDDSTISLAVNGSPRRVAEFLKHLGRS